MASTREANPTVLAEFQLRSLHSAGGSRLVQCSVAVTFCLPLFSQLPVQWMNQLSLPHTGEDVVLQDLERSPPLTIVGVGTDLGPGNYPGPRTRHRDSCNRQDLCTCVFLRVHLCNRDSIQTPSFKRLFRNCLVSFQKSMHILPPFVL